MRTLVLAALALVGPIPASGTPCDVRSGTEPLPLAELYTSGGCDSCPAADRWLSERFPPGGVRDAVPLALHVDCWDGLGWADRFARREFTARQYAAVHAQGQALVYTPQFVVQGRTVEAGSRDAVDRAIRGARARAAEAAIVVQVRPGPDMVQVGASAALAPGEARANLALFVAYVDSGLVSEVAAGENRGKRLLHDHVVRDLRSARLPVGREAQAAFALRRPEERGDRATVVAFVQDLATGDVLQSVALALDACR